MAMRVIRPPRLPYRRGDLMRQVLGDQARAAARQPRTSVQATSVGRVSQPRETNPITQQLQEERLRQLQQKGEDQSGGLLDQLFMGGPPAGSSDMIGAVEPGTIRSTGTLGGAPLYTDQSFEEAAQRGVIPRAVSNPMLSLKQLLAVTGTKGWTGLPEDVKTNIINNLTGLNVKSKHVQQLEDALQKSKERAAEQQPQRDFMNQMRQDSQQRAQQSVIDRRQQANLRQYLAMQSNLERNMKEAELVPDIDPQTNKPNPRKQALQKSIDLANKWLDDHQEYLTGQQGEEQQATQQGGQQATTTTNQTAFGPANIRTPEQGADVIDYYHALQQLGGRRIDQPQQGEGEGGQ